MRLLSFPLRRLPILFVLGFLTAAPRAEVRLPPIIGDNMVLQQGLQTNLWGWADAGETVRISLGDQLVGTVTGNGPDRPWRFELPPLAAGAAPSITFAGRNSITVKKILVGEVWLCSGQSNMEMSVRAIGRADGRDIVDEATKDPEINEPGIRLFDKRWDKWMLCRGDAASSFSAVGFYFGMNLERELNVPIGLIGSSVGGTKIEPWTPLEAAKADPEFQPAFAFHEEYVAKLPENRAAYERNRLRWEAAAETSRSLGLKIPRPPREPHPAYRFEPSGLFREKISALVPYTIRGVAWYQGESNRDDGLRYEKLLSTMIDAWRKQWNQPDMPFLIVQIANFIPGTADYATYPERRENLAKLRAAQAKVAAAKSNAALISTIDIGEANNIHPKNKQEVGRRLMLAALGMVYARDNIVFSGPTFASGRIEGDKALLTFENPDGGLAHTGDSLLGFEIAGADGVYVPARAVAGDDSVVVSNPSVAQPRFARYGWADSPVCSLVNGAGLPAVPFQTRLLE